MNFKNLLQTRNLLLFCTKNFHSVNRFLPFETEPGIYPFQRRQVPLDGLKSFDERIKEIEIAKFGIKLDAINIGCDLPQESIHVKKIKSKNLELLARKRKLIIDTDKLYDQSKNCISFIKGNFEITKFYGIYDDLFHYPHFFYSIKPMVLAFDCEDDSSISVFNGNLLSPANASNEPILNFESDDNSLWTLVMSSPDEHLEYNDKEYVHWIISNINMKDGHVQNKDCIVPYLQPIPYLGTGFHRYVFVLYKQNQGHIDLSKYHLSPESYLEQRTFSSYEFLKTNQDMLTPVSIAFFQAAWDVSVRKCFREQLNCLEPLFEYVWPKQQLKPMKHFPENEIMHRYLDQYRDTFDIQTEVLKERLKTVDPFQVHKRLEYPLAIPNDPNEMNFVKRKYEDREIRRKHWKDMDIIDEFSNQ